MPEYWHIAGTLPDTIKERGGSFLLTGRSFLLTVGLCYLRWSFLLTVEIRFGLFTYG